MKELTAKELRAAVAKLKESAIPEVHGMIFRWAPGTTEEFKAELLAEGWLDCTKKQKKRLF